jgi:hypothetical protein
MASTYTTLLKTEQQADGENSGTWGQKANVVFVLLEEALAGMETVAVTGGTDVLTDSQGVSNQARNAILKITGVLTSNETITIPSRSKTYVVWNATSGSYTLQIGASGGTLVTIPQGSRAMIFCDGTDSYEVFSEILKKGKQTIWVPAQAITPATTSPCGDLSQVEVSAGKPEAVALPFDASTEEYGQFFVALPKSWNASTVTFQAVWTANDATTNSVVWGLQSVSMADGEALAGTYGTAVTVTDANQSATYRNLVTAESAAITIAGTPADSEVQAFRVYRKAADGSDTMAADALLLGLNLFVTIDAANDA